MIFSFTDDPVLDAEHYQQEIEQQREHRLFRRISQAIREEEFSEENIWRDDE